MISVKIRSGLSGLMLLESRPQKNSLTVHLQAAAAQNAKTVELPGTWEKPALKRLYWNALRFGLHQFIECLLLMAFEA